MPFFRKKPITIEATQWFKQGDHAAVSEYRCNNDTICCMICSRELVNHGWVETLEGGHIVCPSDWIITGIANEYYPCKNDIFLKTYDAI